MDISLLVAILLLIGTVLLLILYPLWQQTNSKTAFQISDTGQTLEEHQAHYRAALAAIKDLTFDYEMGKVSSQDYEMLLAKSKLDAAKIRQQIDLLSNLVETAPVDEAVDREIEQLVAQLRNGHQPTDELLLSEVEVEIELLKNRQISSTIACHNCGKPLQPDDAFCSRCGQPVVQKADSPPDGETCPTCGSKIEAGDAFCAKCGTALNQKPPIQTYEKVN